MIRNKLALGLSHEHDAVGRAPAVTWTNCSHKVLKASDMVQRLDELTQKVERELERLSSESNSLLASSTKAQVARRLIFGVQPLHISAPQPHSAADVGDEQTDSSSSSSESPLVEDYVTPPTAHRRPPAAHRRDFASLELKLQDKNKESSGIFAQVQEVKRRAHLKRIAWRKARHTCAAFFDRWCVSTQEQNHGVGGCGILSWSSTRQQAYSRREEHRNTMRQSRRAAPSEQRERSRKTSKAAYADARRTPRLSFTSDTSDDNDLFASRATLSGRQVNTTEHFKQVKETSSEASVLANCDFLQKASPV